MERYLHFVLAQQLLKEESSSNKEMMDTNSNNRNTMDRENIQSMEMVLETLISLYRLAELEISRQEKLVCYQRGSLLENVIENITMLNANINQIRNNKLINEMKKMKLNLNKESNQAENNFEELKLNVDKLLDEIHSSFQNVEQIKSNAIKQEEDDNFEVLVAAARAASPPRTRSRRKPA